MFLKMLALGALAAYSGAAEVRVGVFGLFRPERVVVRAAPGVALKVSAGQRGFILYDSEQMGARAAGSEVDVFAHREQSAARAVQVSARDGGAADFVVSVPGKIERRFRGVLEVRAAAGVLSVVVSMDLETAVSAAVAAEMPEGSGLEALKAMSVLARSYYSAGGRRHGEVDFCDTTHCQFHRSPAAEGSGARAAAEATRGLALVREGRPAAAMYSASCGGKTRAAAGYESVECAVCQRESPVWERRLSYAAAGGLLSDRSEEARLEVVRRLGWSAVPGGNFTIRRDGDEVVLNGCGEGHGIGMCQRGALGMAAEGRSFRDILLHYLPGFALGSKNAQAGAERTDK